MTFFNENIKKFHSEKNVLTFSLDLDPDPQVKPYPHIMNADPKHC
jgi:hypothetical protein